MSAGETLVAAWRLLELCVAGEVPEANALSQLVLHLHCRSPRAVLAVLSEKANGVVANADVGAAATRPGVVLINAASFLDSHVTKQEAPQAEGSNGSASVSKALPDHVLLLTGGQRRAAKKKLIRAQGCMFVAAFTAVVPNHEGAEAKLVEFATDRVASIREKAAGGLAVLTSSTAECVLAGWTNDPCTAVCASAGSQKPIAKCHAHDAVLSLGTELHLLRDIFWSKSFPSRFNTHGTV